MGEREKKIKIMITIISKKAKQKKCSKILNRFESLVARKHEVGFV